MWNLLHVSLFLQNFSMVELNVWHLILPQFWNKKRILLFSLWGRWERVLPIHQAFLMPGLPFFPDVVHVKVFAYMGLHPKTEKSYRNFLNEKHCVNMFILSNFRAGKGYPPSIKLYWFLVCLFFPDVVHVKVFAYMGLHPKTGKKLPQLSQWKALCKHVHFEQFSGWGKGTPHP